MNDELLTAEELTTLAKKVKDDSATNEERIQYLEIVNGLADEYLAVIKSVPTDAQLAETK